MRASDGWYHVPFGPGRDRFHIGKPHERVHMDPLMDGNAHRVGRDLEPTHPRAWSQPRGVFPVPKNRSTVKWPSSRVGIQVSDNSMVSLEKRTWTSQNPDFRCSGATFERIFHTFEGYNKFRNPPNQSFRPCRIIIITFVICNIFMHALFENIIIITFVLHIITLI